MKRSMKKFLRALNIPCDRCAKVMCDGFCEDDK